jgi:hypothetical protein
VAVYAGGRTGPHAVAGKEILATVPCDESFPDVIADVIQSYHAENEYTQQAAFSDPLFTAAATVGLASWRSSSFFAPRPARFETTCRGSLAKIHWSSDPRPTILN